MVTFSTSISAVSCPKNGRSHIFNRARHSVKEKKRTHVQSVREIFDEEKRRTYGGTLKMRTKKEIMKERDGGERETDG